MPKITLSERRVAADGTVVYVAVRARIIHPLTPRHLSQLAAWRPILERHREEDASWDWSAILAEHLTTGGRTFESFGIVCRGKLQGAMLLGQGERTSRASGRPIVYVEYIATAPWNRSTIEAQSRFKGAGTELLAAAVEWSRHMQCEGALGLHSKPRALGFYGRQGFRDLGPDARELGLHYLEINT
jgi:GNAT superfamily N-acetyltransferase